MTRNAAGDARLRPPSPEPGWQHWAQHMGTGPPVSDGCSARREQAWVVELSLQLDAGAVYSLRLCARRSPQV